MTETDGHTPSPSNSLEAETSPSSRSKNSRPSVRGRYRLREQVHRQGSLVVSTQPLAVASLNDVGGAVIEHLDTESFRSVSGVAERTAQPVDVVGSFLFSLERRGFLEWQPSRTESFRPPVSVVVTVRNQRSHLAKCLDALATLTYPEYEVIVVDDGSTDGTVRTARDHALGETGQLRVLEVGTVDNPIGIGASRNAGVATASHDIIAFTDADCRPRAEWLADLVPYLAAHDVVGGRVRPHGESRLSAYEGHYSSLDMGSRPKRVERDSETPYLPTANLVGRRHVFEDVEFPDRNIAEDVEFCWQAIEGDYDVVYSADGVVEHAYRETVREFASRRAEYGGSEGLLAQRFGHRSTVALPVLPALSVSALFASVAWFGAGHGRVIFSISALLVVWAGSRIYAGCQVGSSHVTFATALQSVGRRLLSGVYAVGREISRYYTLPLVSVAGTLVLGGYSAVGIAVAVGVGVAVIATITIDHVVRQPAIGVWTHLGLTVLDDAAYQLGVYRGAVAHRTLAHLAPWRRFSPRFPTFSALTAAVKAHQD